MNPAGELPVILCVSDGKRLAERETGITLSRLGWNEKLGWLCTTYPYYSAYSDHLLDELIEADIALDLPVDRKRLSALCSSTSDLDSRLEFTKLRTIVGIDAAGCDVVRAVDKSVVT